MLQSLVHIVMGGEGLCSLTVAYAFQQMPEKSLELVQCFLTGKLRLECCFMHLKWLMGPYVTECKTEPKENVELKVWVSFCSDFFEIFFFFFDKFV